MNTNSELKDNQIGCFWLPTTPAKPNSTKHQPICTNWQENLSVQANQWVPETQVKQVSAANSSEAGKLVADFLQEAQHQSLHPFCGSKDPNNISSSHVSNSQTEAANTSIYDDNLRGLDTWQPCTSTNTNACGEDPSMNNKFLIDDVDKWTNMSFGDLLALAHGSGNLGAENVVAQTDFVATNITSSFQLHPLEDARQYKMSLGSSSITQIESGLATESEARLNNIPDILTDGSSIPSRPFFDINMPMGMTTDTSSNNTITSLFEPITPEKTNKTGRRSAVQDFSIDEVPAAEEKHENNTGSKEVQESQQKKELSQLAADQLCATASTQGQENHKPDKGDTEEAHLIKTPQQKPRRKKHRPKVIIEGQRQSTPKQKSEKNGNLQETTRVKRKYTRRKGNENPTNIPLEVETSGTYSVNNAPNTEDSPLRKRKYARRKGINKHDDNMDKGTPQVADIKTTRHTRSSCRRSLNFNSETQVGDEDSPYSPTSSHGMEARENSDPKDQTGHVELLKNDPMRTGQSGCTRGKCQIVFSDFTHDKEANIPRVTVNPNGQWTPKSPDGSICSNTCLTLERQARGLKRQNTGTTAEAECSNKNATGMFYNSLQAYRSIFSQNADIHNIAVGMHFPAICKKKRTQKGHSTATSSMQSARTGSENQVKYENEPLRDSCTKLFRSNGNQGPSVAQCKDANLLMHNPATDVIQIQNQRQIFQSLLALGPAERIRKKRSKVPTRVRDLASLLEICKELPASASGGTTSYRTQQAIDILHKPHTCMETLVAVTHSTVTRKRSKRNTQIKSTVQNLYNHQQFATNSIAFNTGPRLAITWKSVSPIDLIIQQLNQLDLSADVSQVSAEKQNALMAYHMHYQQMGALVPYQRGGAVVPFDSSFNQVRRRRPRPKVELDDETTRVWKLLLENINSEGIDGTDEEKAQWWEEERKVFVGRADSFIARMHLIQGDRRFSPWKGSVIDSVVGVFLTQNVSDHLSSSAFMSLAAKFPLQSKANIAESDDENVDTKIIEPEAFGLDLNEKFELKKEVLNKPVCGEDTEMSQDFQENEIKVNSAISSGKDFDISVPKDSLAEQLQDIYKQHPLMSHESAEDGLTRLVEDIRDTDEALSSQTSVISSQNSADSPVGQCTERNESFLQSTSAEKPISGVEPDRFTSTSFLKLLQMAGNVIHGVYEECCEEKGSDKNEQMQSGSSELNSQNEDNSEDKSCDKSTSSLATNSGEQAAECFDWSEENSNFSDTSSAKLCTTELSELSTESESQTMSMKFKVASFEAGQSSGTKSHSIDDGQIRITKQIVQNQTGHVIPQIMCQENNYKTQEVRNIPSCPQNFMDVRETSGNIDNSRKPGRKEVKSSNNDPDYNLTKAVNGPKARGRPAKQKQNSVDWDCLRKEAQAGGKKREKTANTMDSVDWDAVRCSDVNEIAQTIKERGMNNMLAERIKDFLNRLVKDHGSIDLEWLRDVPPDKAKEYLLSVRGLGLKSVECVRLLTLHHLAFPVDTNVGRIAVRLGWVPLQPLPESLQLHLLELYPVLESIQKYLWPRLCKLDQRTLYELHYQMITFGKVFCTKSKPNCNACPMRAECRHFASAFASARLALPAPEDKSITIATGNKAADQNPIRSVSTMQLPSLQTNQTDDIYSTNHSQPIVEEPATPEPIIEVPASPEPAYTQVPECYTENTLEEDPDEIPTIQLNMEEFTQNLQKIMQQKTEMHEGDLSKALIALSTEAASIPVPKLKNISQLRTEHQVYELPDSHPLLERMDKREPDDPCPYLLAIWTPGETVDSTEPPQRMCSSTGSEKLCTEETCLSCNSFREACSQTVRGTLLIPCRTAMRGSFPLNGTYFQVNEVFSDHESSLVPMDIPREWLWNLPRRTVYFGTSIPTIFKGLSTEGIQYCFWRGFVCVRGFDRKTRAPRPLIARLHFPASKRAKGKWKTDDN